MPSAAKLLLMSPLSACNGNCDDSGSAPGGGATDGGSTDGGAADAGATDEWSGEGTDGGTDGGASDGGASDGGAGGGSADADEDGFTVEEGDYPYDCAGWSVTGAGDLDGDGLADITLGAWAHNYTDTDMGAVYVLLGPLSGSTSVDAAYATVLGDESAAYLGHSVAGGGDADGHGQPDLLIGADGAASGPGQVYVVTHLPIGSSNASDAAEAVLSGSCTYAYVGGSVDGAGDFDGDGLADIVFGAQWDSSDLSGGGAA